MYHHFCLFYHVLLLVAKPVIPPPPPPKYYRGQRYLPEVFLWGGGAGGGCSRDMQWILGRVPLETCDFSVIASWISLLVWEFFCGCAAFFWGIYPLDYFWVTAFVILLLVITVSFVCTTLTMFMCFA